MPLANYVDPLYSINGEHGHIVARSPAMLELLQSVEMLADEPTTVLIRGESGTGKELIAKALHYNSRRNARSYRVVNCAGVPTELLESTLFGHVKGAFTGAYQHHTGMVLAAEGGTLFLDEIGDMPLSVQAKVLRLLQEKEVTPVGSTEVKHADVRMVAATNLDLEKLVGLRQFREDLFYRLSVFPLYIPPLAERKADLPLIAEYLLEKHARKRLSRMEFSRGALECLDAREHWPGNIRELENVIEHAVILARGNRTDTITAEYIVFDGKRPTNDARPSEDRMVQRPQLTLVESLPAAEQPKAEEQEKSWWADGVLPITVGQLSNYPGAKHFGALYEKLLRGEAYVEDFGHSCSKVIYLTPDNLDSFVHTYGRTALLDEMQRRDFSSVLNRPCKMYSVTSLREDQRCFWRTDSTIKKRVFIHNLPRLSGKTLLFFLHEDTARHFLQTDQRQEPDAFLSDLHAHYERLKNWKPGTLFAIRG